MNPRRVAPHRAPVVAQFGECLPEFFVQYVSVSSAAVCVCGHRNGNHRFHKSSTVVRTHVYDQPFVLVLVQRIAFVGRIDLHLRRKNEGISNI